MRKAFTLLELMVVIAVIGLMISIGVVSIAAGKGAVRVKGAARDVYGAIRRARSTALVTGQPAIVTYSTVRKDGETMAKVEIASAKLFDTATDRSQVQTLSGAPLKTAGMELVHIEGAKAEAFAKDGAAGADSSAGDGAADSGAGETVADILFAPVDDEVVKGMRLKVVRGDEALAEADTGRKTRISVFSNVDYLIGRYKDAKAEAQQQEQARRVAAGDETTGDGASSDEDQEPVSVVWETNGRVEPHQVWVYADGQRPEEGLLIRIDRFGAAKVLPGDGREED
ncbi:MAG: Tfp pilus assembly protein FimT/FimU [Kiritimatiellia bacterium]